MTVPLSPLFSLIFKETIFPLKIRGFGKLNDRNP